MIIVRSALYGRMKARRCITSDYANALGCYSDVTDHVDGLCSGRQNCSLLVATMDSVAQPCAKDFKSYLEAAYDCVPGNCLSLLFPFDVWYAVAEWYGAGLAIARSWVRIPPEAAVYQRQLSMLSLRGHLMISSLRATG